MTRFIRSKMVIMILTICLGGNLLIPQNVSATELNSIEGLAGIKKEQTVIETALKLNPSINPAMFLPYPNIYKMAFTGVAFSSLQEAIWANTTMMILQEVNGGVFVKKVGEIEEIKGIDGMTLREGDSVRTEEGSAIIRFTTGSKMTIGQNTQFTINKAERTSYSGGKVSIELKSGTLWNKVKNLVNVEDEYEIETPTAVLGVRGTLFLVSVDPVMGGSSMSAVMEGSIIILNNYMGNDGGHEYFVAMGNSIIAPPPPPAPWPFDSFASYNPPPSIPLSPPQPINMEAIVQNQAPFILANMAMDMVDRMQELQQQTDFLLASYPNTNNQDYLQSALQQSQVNNLLGDLSQSYMNAVQGSTQEQQMNQILQQQNRNMEALGQQLQQLSEQAQQTRNDAENAAQQAGFDPDQIQWLLQNAITAAAVDLTGVAPPPPPSSPPTSGGRGGSGSGGGSSPVVDVGIAADIDNQITALPAVSEMTLAYEADVMAVRERYSKLTTAQKALVTKLSILEAAEAKIAELREAVPGNLSVESVREFMTIEVEYGASPPNLPGYATIVLSDHSEVFVPVHWSGQIDVTVAGTHILIGTLDLSTLENVMPTELTATIQVIVAEEVTPELTVESIIASDASTLIVKFVDMESVVITLTAPLTHEQSEVTFTYEGRVYTAILDIPWVDNAVVDVGIAADIDNQITALPAVSEMTLAYEADVMAVRERYSKLTTAQKALVTKLSILEAAEAKIAELREAVPGNLSVESVREFMTIEVEYGASPPNLPGYATIVLSDHSEVFVPVHWSGQIDVTVAGTHILIGTLDLSTLENVMPTELTATIQVVVAEEVAPTN